MCEVPSLRWASIGLDKEATQKPGSTFVFSARTRQCPLANRRHDVSLVKNSMRTLPTPTPPNFHPQTRTETRVISLALPVKLFGEKFFRPGSQFP